MKYTPFLLFALLFGCGNTTKGDAEFETFSQHFIENLWKQNPSWATSVGYHKYDSILTIPNEENRQKSLTFSTQYLDSLKQFDFEKLSKTHQTDYLILENYLKSNAFYINEFKSFEWDPSGYNFGETLFKIMSNKEAKPANIIANLNKFLSNTNAYFTAAKQNIKNPTREHTELALSQLKGTKEMLEKGDIASFFDAQKSEKTQLLASIKDIDGFLEFLQDQLNQIDAGKIKPRSYSIGKELFTKKFDYEIQSKFTAEEIYNKALSRKKEIQGEMYRYASKLWTKYYPNTPIEKDSMLCVQKVIDAACKSHVNRDQFLAEIERQIPILTEFVTSKNLIDMDPTKPLKVRKEPEWMAGVAGASISSPGPYEKNENTYYNVGTLAQYAPEEAESFLREYNQYMLQILNIHEAIPGHYVQLIHANKSPSMIQNIMGNGAFIEGWAVYSERMMMEEGWDKNTSINATESIDEMWLFYLKWHLRAACNTILDYSVHCKNISKVDAMKLLVKEAFQQPAEAEGKWRRATLSQVQLCSYFTGYTDIYEFRQGLKNKDKNFNLKEFHNKLLSFGSPPLKYIETMY